MNPVARRMSSLEAKASLARSSEAPRKPSRLVSVVRIDARMCGGMKAATTMTNGKKDTNALPARATLRSTNSVSSMRSQTRQGSRCCAHSMPASTRTRVAAIERWARVGSSAMSDRRGLGRVGHLQRQLPREPQRADGGDGDADQGQPERLDL